jgi:hypothetical protein
MNRCKNCDHEIFGREIFCSSECIREFWRSYSSNIDMVWFQERLSI